MSVRRPNLDAKFRVFKLDLSEQKDLTRRPDFALISIGVFVRLEALVSEYMYIKAFMEILSAENRLRGVWPMVSFSSAPAAQSISGRFPLRMVM